MSKSKADRHKKSGDEYEKQGGDKATRNAVDVVRAQEVAERQRIEAAKAELRRDR
ncbi:hypothetical protein [Jiangella asiatica]|uniref:hypothetical protein n=1 Tax=Jiangella asiatica TaxID=2530372 RepID=UPI0013A5ED17|nr:hypothetical protein [Jiangella asiatica]